MYGWLITWSCWWKILVLKNTKRETAPKPVFPFYWNKWNLVKREMRTIFCLVSRISTVKSKSILHPSIWLHFHQSLYRVIYQRTRREVIIAFPFTCNLQQMHITLSEGQSINCDHTITIYQQGCQLEQIPRLELVMMSSNPWKMSFKSCVCACVSVFERERPTKYIDRGPPHQLRSSA